MGERGGNVEARGHHPCQVKNDSAMWFFYNSVSGFPFMRGDDDDGVGGPGGEGTEAPEANGDEGEDGANGGGDGPGSGRGRSKARGRGHARGRGRGRGRGAGRRAKTKTLLVEDPDAESFTNKMSRWNRDAYLAVCDIGLALRINGQKGVRSTSLRRCVGCLRRGSIVLLACLSMALVAGPT